MKSVADLGVKIYADGADLRQMSELARKPWIKGFTTNPTLMRKAGVSDYGDFAREAVRMIPDRPISFEVFSDEFEEMAEQAREIDTWGDNVYVKIPITNTRGKPSGSLIQDLSRRGVKVNVTAILALEQVCDAVAALQGGAPGYVSVFAGRVADTGRDPMPLMSAARALVGLASNIELIWASPRELLNVYQAEAVGCHIITATHDILQRLGGVGKDLYQFSLETVQMFRNDAIQAGYVLHAPARSTV